MRSLSISETALRQRLQNYSLDQARADFPFSHKLAWENGWSLTYARRVIEEYKRFGFLAVAAGHPVTPSDQVDQVWHLHLTYTRSYWDVFCGQVLQMPLHHEPTEGGPVEQTKFHDWYRQTLDSYERFFGPPPPDIWPPLAVRFGRDLHFRRVNTQQHWVVPKGAIALRRWAVLLGLAIALFTAGVVYSYSPENPSVQTESGG